MAGALLREVARVRGPSVPGHSGRVLAVPVLPCCVAAVGVTALAPVPMSAASSQDSFCSPVRFLLLFDSARPVLLARAVVLLQASPGGERLLPSGRRAGRLRGRTSPRRAALSWPFSSSPGAFVFLAGCGGPFLSCFCLLFLLPWMFVAFPHGECAERKAALTSRC